MVQKQISLRELQRAVAIEKTKLRKMQERERLQRELKQLRGAGRTDIAGRIGRGFVILSKKAGSVAMKQARLIRERQIEESKRTKKKGGRSLTGRDDIFAPLDF